MSTWQELMNENACRWRSNPFTMQTLDDHNHAIGHQHGQGTHLARLPRMAGENLVPMCSSHTKIAHLPSMFWRREAHIDNLCTCVNIVDPTIRSNQEMSANTITRVMSEGILWYYVTMTYLCMPHEVVLTKCKCERRNAFNIKIWNLNSTTSVVPTKVWARLVHQV